MDESRIIGATVEDEDWPELVHCEDLTREVILDEYLAELVAPLVRRAKLLDDAQTIVATRKAPLAALVQPGDEWWQWVKGSEPLMQTGGLALVRNGIVVWARLDWIS